MIRDFLHMIRYCRPQWRLYALGSLALLFVDLLDTFQPKFLQWAIDHLVSIGKEETPDNLFLSMLPEGWFGEGAVAGGLWTYAVAFVLVIGVTGVFRVWMSLAFARAAEHSNGRGIAKSSARVALRRRAASLGAQRWATMPSEKSP